MNRGAIFGSLAVASLLVACGSTEVDLGSRPQFSDGGNVLTVLAYDGITGAAVTGAAVTVRVGSHVLTATAASNAYTVSNLPGGDLPIFVQSTGYLAFSGVATLGAATDPANPVYTTRVIILYADTQVPSAYTIKVYDNVTGAAVTGGEVILSLDTYASSDIGSAISTDIRIDGNYDYRPAANVYTLASGVATIPAADLIYGATYYVDVVGATLGTTGKYLTQIYDGTTTTINPPVTFPIKEVFMTPVSQAPVVLTYSTAGTPKPITKDITAPLKITFAAPVEDCTLSTENDFFDETIGGSKAAVTTTSADNAKMTITDGGLTVTLSLLGVPTSFNAAPVSTAAETITYNSNFKVRVVGTVGDSSCTGSSCNCVSLTAVLVRGSSSAVIDPEVIIYQP